MAKKKKLKKTAAKKKATKKPAKAPKIYPCALCLADDEPAHDCVPVTERQLFAKFDEDFQDAFRAVKDLGTSFGDQRIYNNARAVMFSRRVCYMFVRPKKSFVELVFFLPKKLRDPRVHATHQVSKTKVAHTVRVTHADQIEEPVTDWLREAYEFAV